MRCPMCGGVGWTLDANGAGTRSPVSLELIRCFHPACDAPTTAIANLVFKGPRLTQVSRHPTEGWIMSVGA